MKAKRLIPVLLVLVLIFALLPLTAMAAGKGDSNAKLPYVTDTYGLLTDSERASLERQAAEASAKHGCSFYVLVVRNYRDYASDTFRFAQAAFEEYNLGWGSEKNGVMLMLSMEERDYELLFHPESNDDVFTEYGRDKMEERFLRYFRNNDFAGGFREYLNCCDEYYDAYESGHPIDRPKNWLLAMIPGAIAALFTGSAVKAPMKSIGLKRNANAYVEGSLQITNKQDNWVNHTQTRVRRQTQQNRSSGSGSSHHSGSYSGRSGKF